VSAAEAGRRPELGPIAVATTSPATREPLQAIVAETLAELGHEARLVDDRELVPGEAALVWLTGSANWYPGTRRRLLAAPAWERPRIVLWHTEPLPLPRAAGLRLARLHAREVAKIVLRDRRRQDPRSNVRGLLSLLERDLPDVLVVSTLERQEFLTERGIASAFVPLGYREQTHGRDLGLERDVDVLFLGTSDVPRRRRILRLLRREGVSVLAVGGWHDPAFWGESRTRLLNRTKILLNLPRHPGLLSGYRMLLGMANRALVLAEPIYAPAPYRPGVHFVSAPLAELPRAVLDLLADDDARLAITSAAHRFVTRELTMARSVESILDLAAR
jgi:hypothetical protein